MRRVLGPSRLQLAVIAFLLCTTAAKELSSAKSYERPADGRSIPDWWPVNASVPAPLPDLDALVRDAGVSTHAPFLLLGVLTSYETAHRRAAVRVTWQRYVTHMPTQMVLLRYVMSRSSAEVCSSA